MAVATQNAATAAGFGPNQFMNIDGNVRYVASPSPVNQFGWGNSGGPASGCPAGQTGTGGSKGLFNCASPNPLGSAYTPLPPKYKGPAIGTNGVLGEHFVTTPDNQPVDCGAKKPTTGAFIFGGGDKWDSGFSQLSYSVGPVTPKDGVADAYLLSRANTVGDIEVYMGAQRTENHGDSHVDFQFLQDSVGASGNCSGTFSGSREQGDVMVAMNYVNGGGTQAPSIYVWTCTTPSPGGTKCDTSGTWQLTNVGSGAVQNSNSSTIPCGGWICEGPLGPGQIGATEFVEGAVNLNQLFSVDPSVGCTSSVFVETRTSQSGPGQIKALAKPFAFPTCRPTTTTTTPSSKTVPLGTSVTDNVTVSSGFYGAPVGKVAFYVCSNSTTGCDPTQGTLLTGTGASPNPATLTKSGANASAATSPSFTPPAPGNYCFAGVYEPTAGKFFKPSADTSAGECFNVPKVSSLTATTASGATTLGAGGLSDNVSVSPKSGAGPAPTGTVTFYVCKTTSTFCPATGTPEGTKSLTTPSSGNTSTATSPGFTPPTAGTWCFSAVYSGDNFYLGSEDNTNADNTRSSECVTVGPAPSATTTTVMDGTTGKAWTGLETAGASAFDTATVAPKTPFANAPVPTGTISYLFFTNSGCTGEGAPAGTLLPLGSPSTSESSLAQGSYGFEAIYSGDSNYQASTGACEPFSLGFPVITAAKSSSPADGSVVHPGDTVTYTITLTNTGLSGVSGLVVTDVVPAGTTYVPNSASNGGTLSGSTITWTGLAVPALKTTPVSFQVTVNANDTDGQVIPNHAVFPNVNTPQNSCVQSSDTVPQITADSVQVSDPFCDTNTVTLTVAIPIINVVKSEPTPGNGQTVTAGQSGPITYNLTVSNSGSAAATNLVVTDVIPAGSTYVPNSATPGADAVYNSTTQTITWTIPTVPAKSSSTVLSFKVTVNSSDDNGSTIVNQASFTNLNTPNCTSGPTSATCLTNTVSNPVVTPPVPHVTPAPQVAPTTTTTVAKHALAFTGLNARTLAILAMVLVGGGTILVLIGRRRRPSQNR